jgi:hypothetical protein
MEALIEALDHPERADLSILDKLQGSGNTAGSLLQSQTIKGILIAVGIVAVLVVIAMVLQQFRP